MHGWRSKGAEKVQDGLRIWRELIWRAPLHLSVVALIPKYEAWPPTCAAGAAQPDPLQQWMLPPVLWPLLLYLSSCLLLPALGMRGGLE